MRARLMGASRSSGAPGPLFADRVDAGRRLGERLAAYSADRPIVLGIPRGGVPVAAEVARLLGAELDVVVARKLGAPHQPELAIGATTAHGGRYLNEEVIEALGVARPYIEQVTASETAEARRREERFGGGRGLGAVAGRVAILVDDGLATGATMRAAARAVRAYAPSRLVVAVPVGAAETCEDMRDEADEIVCLAQPEPFWAVGLHYAEFGQTSDEDVQRILDEWRRASAAPSAAGDPAVDPADAR